MYYCSALYLLTRLPRGASISVLVAQALSLAVAVAKINLSAAALSENGGVRSNAFVGYILCQ